MSESQKFEMVKYVFTDAEKLVIGDNISAAINQKELYEDELKDIKADYKAKAERLDFEIKQNAARIKDGYEMRRTEVTEEKDYDSKTINFRSVETGEIVKSRTMTIQECQMEI